MDVLKLFAPYGPTWLGGVLLMLVASGARSGESYTFTVDLVETGTRGFKHIFARCL